MVSLDLRFIVVMDDLDRLELSVAEVFRLVRAVADLPALPLFSVMTGRLSLMPLNMR
ncbi:hypothetical protein O5171_13790 [Escherichia coli]|nr:hypothetical protein [Escherichia coli]